MQEIGRKVEYKVEGQNGTKGAADEILSLIAKIKPVE
jgi:hypothetical protein